MRCSEAAVTAECDGSGIGSPKAIDNERTGSRTHSRVPDHIDSSIHVQQPWAAALGSNLGQRQHIPKTPKVEDQEEPVVSGGDVPHDHQCDFVALDKRRCQEYSEYSVPVWDAQPVPREPPGRVQSGNH